MKLSVIVLMLSALVSAEGQESVCFSRSGMIFNQASAGTSRDIPQTERLVVPERILTDISSPRRLRVKGADTDSSMGCRIESGETGIQVSDGISDGEPIAKAHDLGVLTRQQNSKPNPHEFRVLPAYHPKPNRFLAAIKRHPKWTIGLSLAIGGGTGWFIDHETSVSCKEYPPGKNGVLAHCP